jgi:hypothetical protein
MTDEDVAAGNSGTRSRIFERKRTVHKIPELVWRGVSMEYSSRVGVEDRLYCTEH